jgi:hypothetical protein
VGMLPLRPGVESRHGRLAHGAHPAVDCSRMSAPEHTRHRGRRPPPKAETKGPNQQSDRIGSVFHRRNRVCARLTSPSGLALSARVRHLFPTIRL